MRIRDERLAWLAVSDRLARRSRRFGVMGWVAMISTFGLAAHGTRHIPANRMKAYSVAVDRAAEFLSAQERVVLRSEGTVPPWFLPEVERLSRAVRRGRPVPTERADAPRPRIVRWLRLGLFAAVVFLAVVIGPAVWLRTGSAGRLYVADRAPATDVAIVLGAQVAPGGTTPMPLLTGRLQVSAQLVREGRVKALLVSGDAHGGSGNEVAVMRAYLVSHGVDPARIVVDPYGHDTYDTCRRAYDVYGLRRALLVTQPLHLPRAVTLCRTLGIDADGVYATCAGCLNVTIAYNTTREWLAGPKAVVDTVRGRRPAVVSPPDRALTLAVQHAG
jgi:vancomycin permeability regulator SanA